MNLIPNYVLTTDETNSNIFETSYVNNPATDKSFLMFNNESSVDKTNINKNPINFAKLNESSKTDYQRITSGVFMMPDTKYIRVDSEGNYYTVSFTKEALYNALIKHLKAGMADNVKLEHSGSNLEGFVTMEYWVIKDENTKSPIFNLSLEDIGYNPQDIPVGTVMKSTYVANEQFWNDMILTGNVSGYSLGGMFELTEYDFNKQSEQFHNAESITELFKLAYGRTFYSSNGTVLTIEDNVVKSNVEGFNGTYQFKFNQVNVEATILNGKVVDFYTFGNDDENKQSDVKVKETAMEAGMIFSNVKIEIEVCVELEQEDKQMLPESVVEPIQLEVQPMMNNLAFEQIEIKFQQQLTEITNKLAMLEEEVKQKDLMIKDKEEAIANMVKKVGNEPIPQQFNVESIIKNTNITNDTPKLRIGDRFI